MTAGTDTAGLMDAIYQNQRYFYDLTRKYYLLGRDHLINQLDVPEGGTVLELGCGTGRNLIAAAKRYPSAQFFGLDISDQMLATARKNIEKAGYSNRIKLIQGDASNAPAVSGFGPDAYSRVFYSYTLSMMPIWREALQTGLANLSGEGKISIVDFGQQERLPSWFRGLLFKWLNGFHVTPRADLQSELSSLAEVHSADLKFAPLYRGYAVYAELRRR
ncbi:methyltransferase type 11 [Roseibium sp. TrichSKD4]|uniref:class I SAM-dependent methyltransferase n=1 Tax=Roseibium sp. TrichSKD4 TaxID=744980 RepID=UPI0001E5611D|nr:class I SAM-dependent methyltransferase [Roseibium sp. TrichSKD4]EFO34384.1 methyltransferase type 11 [Roseibium sp. TrichSKD4]